MSAVLSPVLHGPAISARGRFGEAVAALLQGRIDGHGPELALHLSAAPDLHLLEELQTRHSRVIGAFLFERYAVITPLLEDASACARCFRRRFVSAPPPPYSVEFCESVIANSERDPQFEYAGFLPSTARLVAELVLKSLEVPQAGATPPTVSVAAPAAASVPVKKLNTIGGEFATWGANGRTVHWALGNALFSYDLDRAKVVEDSLKADDRRKTRLRA
ncbi:MAG: hypothetical protein ACOVKS_11550, partial [Aquimonas sp.]